MNSFLTSMTSCLTDRIIAERDLDRAMRLAVEASIPLHESLVRVGAITELESLIVLRHWLGVEILESTPLDKASYESAQETLGLTPRWLSNVDAAVWNYNDEILCASRDITSQQLRETIEIAGINGEVDVRYVLLKNALLEQVLSFNREAIDHGLSEQDDAAMMRELAEEAPVINFVNRVFSFGLEHGASDIHIEPTDTTFRVRYRIDGILRDGEIGEGSRYDAVVTRIKLLSQMDISERRLPQDGRQTIRFGGEEIDLRVSSLPGSQGESMVLRLLRKDANASSARSLGLTPRSQAILDRILSHPNGILLVTGPTGSGKSTTLYQALQSLNNGVRKIITIEDPVEYEMKGIVQIPVNSGIGYTFARGLRAILRQDPDVIMIGEIRDQETAVIASQAALTGHLVLSTLHTNSALAAVARLIDIGLEPYLIASSVRGLAAQRLVRRLCDSCASIVVEDNTLINAVSIVNLQSSWRQAVGCQKCGGTGYKGRVALFEIVEIDEALSQGIFDRANAQTLTRLASESGFISMRDDGIMKASAGLTTLEEVYRVCGQS